MAGHRSFSSDSFENVLEDVTFEDIFPLYDYEHTAEHFGERYHHSNVHVSDVYSDSDDLHTSSSASDLHIFVPDENFNNSANNKDEKSEEEEDDDKPQFSGSFLQAVKQKFSTKLGPNFNNSAGDRDEQEKSGGENDPEDSGLLSKSALRSLQRRRDTLYRTAPGKPDQTNQGKGTMTSGRFQASGRDSDRQLPESSTRLGQSSFSRMPREIGGYLKP